MSLLLVKLLCFCTEKQIDSKHKMWDIFTSGQTDKNSGFTWFHLIFALGYVCGDQCWSAVIGVPCIGGVGVSSVRCSDVPSVFRAKMDMSWSITGQTSSKLDRGDPCYNPTTQPCQHNNWQRDLSSLSRNTKPLAVLKVDLLKKYNKRHWGW